MSSLVSSAESDSLTKDLNNVFDTFSNNRNIVVWKEPIKQAVIVQTQAQLGGFGFGDGQVDQQYTYIPVSGIFPAVIRYADKKHIGEAKLLQDTNEFLPIGEVRIKVRPDCYQFIEFGQTDKISFDNRDWYFVGKSQARPFLGTMYYVYQLKPKI
jgi:hypothetical protein